MILVSDSFSFSLLSLQVSARRRRAAVAASLPLLVCCRQGSPQRRFDFYFYPLVPFPRLSGPRASTEVCSHRYITYACVYNFSYA